MYGMAWLGLFANGLLTHLLSWDGTWRFGTVRCLGHRRHECVHGRTREHGPAPAVTS